MSAAALLLAFMVTAQPLPASGPLSRLQGYRPCACGCGARYSTCPCCGVPGLPPDTFLVGLGGDTDTRRPTGHENAHRNDRDGDGVVNRDDAFPDNPCEKRDLDHDGRGDNWEYTSRRLLSIYEDINVLGEYDNQPQAVKDALRSVAMDIGDILHAIDHGEGTPCEKLGGIGRLYREAAESMDDLIRIYGRVPNRDPSTAMTFSVWRNLWLEALKEYAECCGALNDSWLDEDEREPYPDTSIRLPEFPRRPPPVDSDSDGINDGSDMWIHNPCESLDGNGNLIGDRFEAMMAALRRVKTGAARMRTRYGNGTLHPPNLRARWGRIERQADLLYRHLEALLDAPIDDPCRSLVSHRSEAERLIRELESLMRMLRRYPVYPDMIDEIEAMRLAARLLKDYLDCCTVSVRRQRESAARHSAAGGGETAPVDTVPQRGEGTGTGTGTGGRTGSDTGGGRGLRIGSVTDDTVRDALEGVIRAYSSEDAASFGDALAIDFAQRDLSGNGYDKGGLEAALTTDFTLLDEIEIDEFEVLIHPLSNEVFEVELTWAMRARLPTADGIEWILRDQRSRLYFTVSAGGLLLSQIDGNPLFGRADDSRRIRIDGGNLDGRPVLDGQEVYLSEDGLTGFFEEEIW